jgi:putative flippase GtrA
MASLRQFLIFGCVGLLNTAVHFAVFEVLLRLVGLPLLLASAIGYSAGVANSYVLNRMWTFAVKTRASTVEFGKFVAVNVAALLLNLVVLEQLTSMGLTPEVSQVLAIGASLTANFAGNKWWAFRAAG